MRKVALWLIVIESVLWLLHIPRIGNALMMFCTLGINPFTNRPLSDGQLQIILVSIFIICFELLFHTYVARFVRGLMHRMSDLAHAKASQPLVPLVAPVTETVVVETAAIQAIQPLAKPEFVPIVLPKATRQLFIILRLGRLLQRGVVVTLRTVLPKLDALAARRQQMAYQCVVLHAKSIKWVKQHIAIWTPYVLKTLFILGAIVLVMGLESSSAVKRLWRSFEPYARRFDKFLAKKLHTNDRTYFALIIGHEFMQFVHDAWQLWIRVYDTASDWVKDKRAKWAAPDA